MHFKVLNFLKIIVIIIFIFVTNSVEASKLIFDISNSHITLSNKKKKIVILQFMVFQTLSKLLY